MTSLPYRTLSEYKYVGKSGLRPKFAYKKVAGLAHYPRDMSAPQMLYAKCLVGPYIHAKIKTMDTTKALALPGVWDILRYDDTKDSMSPDTKMGYGTTWGGTGFIDDNTHCSDQPVGVVVCAESEEICDEALKLIEIEWEQLPFAVDPTAALASSADVIYPEINPKSNLYYEMDIPINGDVEKGFKEADKILTFSFQHAQQAAAGVEGNVAMVKWEGDEVYVWSHAKFPTMTEYFLQQDPIAASLPSTKAHVFSPITGGAFGSWGYQPMTHRFPQLAIMLSRRTGRPVKALDDQMVFRIMTMPFGPHTFKVGFKNDGTITAVYAEGTLMTSYFFIHGYEAWAVPNLSIHIREPMLNLPPRATHRDDPMNCYPQQMVTNHIAAELGMDPIKVAKLNEGINGKNAAALAQEKHELGLPDFNSMDEVIKVGKQAIDWDKTWHAPGAKKLPNGKMHGIGFVHAPEWGGGYPMPARVAVRVNFDGKVLLKYRRIDEGMMSENAYARVVADEIGVKFDDIHTDNTTDDGQFNVYGPGGSSGTGTNSVAFIDAARKAKQKILELATQAIPGVTPVFSGKKPEELDIKESMVFEIAKPNNTKTVKEVVIQFNNAGSSVYPLSPSYDIVCVGESPAYHDINYSDAFGRQAQFAEIEVDTDTGEVAINKLVTVNDVGKIVDPDGCNAQQYGGAFMGIGFGLTEEVVHDPTSGVNLNDDLINYKWLTMNDLPNIDCHLLEGGLGPGPYGMSGIGENISSSTHTLMNAAIYNAIGKFVDDFPATPWKILKALGKI